MRMTRLGLVLMSLGVAFLGLRLWVAELQGAGVAAAAASLRTDPARWRTEANTLQLYLERTPVQPGCRGQNDRDMLTLALARADLARPDPVRPDLILTDRADAVGRAETRRLALERAEVQARHLLACSPTDGQAWLDYAILAARLQGRPAAAVPGVLLSSWFAPNDAAPLKARIRYASWLAGQWGGDVVPVLEADLVVFLNWGRLADLRQMLTAQGPRLRPFLGDIPVSGADPARLALVDRARRP